MGRAYTITTGTGGEPNKPARQIMTKTYNPADYPNSMSFDAHAREIAALVEQCSTEGLAIIAPPTSAPITANPGPWYEQAVSNIAVAAVEDAASWRELMAKLGYVKGPASGASDLQIKDAYEDGWMNAVAAAVEAVKKVRDEV